MKKHNVLLLLLLVGVGCLRLKPRSVELPSALQIKSTSELVRRGDYLANHVFACMDCHSQRDFNLYSGPIKANTLGMGGMEFGKKEGIPAKIFVPNLTPAGIGKYSDEQIFSAITSGIGTNGKALFPVMPYQNYAKADPEDIKAIIAYLRSLKPVQNEVPESKIRFPVSWVANSFPGEPHFTKRPDTSDVVQYGKYLVTVAGCGDCHTPRKGARLDESRAFTGGSPMKLPAGGKVRGPNLTPDKSTGLGTWTKASFINRFKTLSLKKGYKPPVVPKGEMQTIMPWTMYAEMDTRDLGAIYEYLQSLKPVERTVQRWTAPKK